MRVDEAFGGEAGWGDEELPVETLTPIDVRPHSRTGSSTEPAVEDSRDVRRGRSLFSAFRAGESPDAGVFARGRAGLAPQADEATQKILNLN